MKKENYMVLFLLVSGFVLVYTFLAFAQPPLKPVEPAPKPRPDIQPSQPPSVTRQPNPALNITEFKATMPSSGISVGDRVTLMWKIEARDVRILNVEIKPGHGYVSEKRTELGMGSFRIEGSTEVRPLDNTIYTLTVNYIPEGQILIPGKHNFAFASVEIKVRKPKLENVQPEIDPKTLNIKFIVKNIGETDFRSKPIEVYYNIEGAEGIIPSSLLAQGSFTTRDISIQKGEQVELGKIQLPNRQLALSFNKLKIRVQISTLYVESVTDRVFISDQDNFVVPWEPSSINLGHHILLKIANSLLRNLKFQINNYRSQSSYIELPPMTKEPKVFNIPEIRKELKLDFGILGEWHWGWYRIWIRDIKNAPFGEEALSIGDGGIKFNIPVEAEGDTEIKCVYDPLDIGGYTDDGACPDLDIRGPINVKIFLIPEVIGGKIGYSRVNVDCKIKDTTFPGAWDWFIELFTGDLKPTIEGIVNNKLKEFLESSVVKDAFRDQVMEILKRLIPDITRVVKIEITGGDFIVWYL